MKSIDIAVCTVAIWAAGCASSGVAVGLNTGSPPQRMESVSVPSRLDVRRSDEILSVAVNPDSSVKVRALSNTVTGVECKLFVYPKGGSRPSEWVRREAPGSRFLGGTHYFDRRRDGFPIPGIEYVVEMDLVVFQTDIPRARFWYPETGKDYVILWRDTLKATVP